MPAQASHGVDCGVFVVSSSTVSTAALELLEEELLFERVLLLVERAEDDLVFAVVPDTLVAPPATPLDLPPPELPPEAPLSDPPPESPPPPGSLPPPLPLTNLKRWPESLR